MSDIIARASQIGREHGIAAASWAFDGNTPDETYRTVLQGIEDGDPAVLDSYRVPSLSGEFADDYSERDLAADLTSGECREQGHDATDHDDWDDAANAYSDAAGESFWDEVERQAREHVVSARTETLRSAGFHVIYAHRPDEGQDWIAWHDYQDYPGSDTEAYVDLSRVGNGDDAYGQVSTYSRSNFRSLMRDYPDTFTVISYSNVNALGAFIADLSDEVVAKLVSLATEYAVYDESDMSELESDEITESFGQYVRCDITGELSEDGQDAWVALPEDAQGDLFWEVCSDLDIYPEHDGRDVRWTVHYPAIAAELDKRLGQS